MNYRFLLLLFFLFFSRFLAAQNVDTSEASKFYNLALEAHGRGDFKAVFENAKNSKTLFEQVLGKNHRRVADALAYMGSGALFIPAERPRDYYLEAHEIYKIVLGSEHHQTVFPKVQYAMVLGFAGDYENCLSILKDCVQKLESNKQTPLRYLALAYAFFGQFSAPLGDVENALLYTNKAIQVFLEMKTKKGELNASNAYLTLGDLSVLQEEFEKAQAFYLQTRAIQKKYLDEGNPNMTNPLTKIASNYLNLAKPDSALHFSRMAEQNLLKNFGANHPLLITTNTIGGLALMKKQQPEAALALWKRAIEVSHAPQNHSFMSLRFEVFLHLAKYFFEKKQFASAQSWCDSVILQSRFDAQNNYEIEKVVDFPNLSRALVLKVRAIEKLLEMGEEPNPEKFLDAQKALENFLRQRKKPNVESVFDAAMQREVLLPATEATLDFAHFFEKNDEKRVVQQFAAAQFAKAEALSIGFQSNRVQHVAGLPDSILQNEKRLKKSLAELHAKLAEAEAKRDSAAAQKLVAEQFEKQRDFDRLQNFIKTSNPKFASLRSETRQPTLDEVRKKLLADRRTALLEYFVGERSIYIFRLTADGVRSWRVERAADFEKWVADFHRAVSDHELLSRDPDFSKKLFFENASRLSDLLLGEPLAELPSEISRLIFVPDGALHYLPFEALFANSNVVEVQNLDDVRRLAWRDFPFLIKKYAVSYGYSTGLLLEQNARPTSRPTRGFAGFAPKYDAKNLRADDTLAAPPLALLVRDGSYELPGAQGEVAAISKLVGGEVFQNDLASEANFRQRAGDFAVLHLAMHALVDDRNPALSRLLFSKTAADSAFDGRLTCGEIYALSLPADLAVLTACNSGFGKLGRGEGAMSLGRAFTFAGVRSTVMSLWQSPDAQTERLMVLFYQNLETGLPKDLALQKAKLECLASGENPALGHPFFWAGCVLNGNSQPLDLPNPDFQIWFLVGLLLLILVLMIGIFRHR